MLQEPPARGRQAAQEGLQAMGVMLCVVWIAGVMMGRVWGSIQRVPDKTPTLRWQQLPSGWSRDFGSLTIYAMTMEQEAYWWVSRNGKTIIEGPAGTLDAAKLEAEREARELSP
jgi:hypothetical protein